MNRRILIIDDNQDIHMDFRRILEDNGRGEDDELDALTADLFGTGFEAAQSESFELESAYQGAEGVEMIRSALDEGRQYAMAFVDMRMPPGIDGLETIRRIWEADPECEIVICTAYSDHGWDEIREALPKSEQFLILKKPFDPVEAHQLAAALTRKWTLARESKDHVEKLDVMVEERTKALRAANARLMEKQKQLVQSEKMASIGQLAAGVAHEINNPIGYVKSNLGTLSDYANVYKELILQYEKLECTSDPAVISEIRTKIKQIKEDEDLKFLMEDMDQLLQESGDGMVRVQEIVQNLKSFARVNDTEFAMADLNAGIEATMRVIWNELKYKCTVEKDYGELPHVACRAGELNQVFMNLLLNASQAIEESGTISIRTWADDENVWISIADTGQGIPADKLHSIFDPFFTTKPVGVGTGLGLSISHGVIESHHGEITVESKVRVGTTFTIRLPISQPE